MKKYVLSHIIWHLSDPIQLVHTSTFKDHVKLWKVLDQIGVTTVVNNPIHCYDTAPPTDGIYSYSGFSLSVKTIENLERVKLSGQKMI